MPLLRSALPLSFALLSVACVEERVNPLPQDARADAVRSDSAPSDDVADTDAAADDALAQDSAVAPRDGGPSCVPNNDGVIERSELPYVVGTQALFVVNDDNTTVEAINTAPTMGAMGLEWDFSAAKPGDRRVLDDVQNPMGRWWQPFYPTANFALAVDRAGSNWALYRSTDTALQILATVSRDTGRTNVAFTPAVDAIRFPLREGSTWTVTSAGNGAFNGIATSTVNTYRFTVDRRGTVLTPATRFSALRLRMDLDQTVTGTVIRRTQRTYLFLSECWGLVARIASVDNETAEEFTRASEYRRLGL
ncbi:MAG: hypothetical protein U0269_02295 [Polyangiales bacterium]